MLRVKFSLPQFIFNITRPQAKVKIPQVLHKSFCNFAPKNNGAAKFKLPIDQAKDQILFHVDHGRYFKLMNLFAFTQFMFWMSISMSAKDMKTIPQPQASDDSQKAWWKKLDLSKYKVPLSIASLVLGCAVLSGCWMQTIRSVKHIVLRKGGTSVTIATPTPFGGTRYITKPLEQVTAKSSRIQGSYMALKIQGQPLHFLVDTRGNFVRPELFDRTVGVRRDLSSKK